MLQVVDDALPPKLAENLYHFTVSQKEPTWGTYVPMKQLLPLVFTGEEEDDKTCNDSNHPHPWPTGIVRPSTSSLSSPPATSEDPTNANLDLEELATHACVWYLRRALHRPDGMLRVRLLLEERSRRKATSTVTPDAGSSDEENDDRWLAQSMSRSAHGIAVWALSSGANAPVSYHVDYAEQVRYRHNVVVLPHLAGTFHCSPPHRAVLEGGALRVYNSLQHYELHGYKGRKAFLPSEENKVDDEGGLLGTVEYRFNRLVIMAGHLPHASTPVTLVEPPHTARRVVVGFNVFGHDIGTMVQAAPEHSATWRRQVKLLRLHQRQQRQRDSQTPRHFRGDGSILAASVSQLSPGMRKLLVLAKRQKVQEEWRREYLSEQLRRALQGSSNDNVASSSSSSSSESELVQRILSQCSSASRTSPIWPLEHDVRRFLREHHYDQNIPPMAVEGSEVA
jgi:hypothetical protein